LAKKRKHGATPFSAPAHTGKGLREKRDYTESVRQAPAPAPTMPEGVPSEDTEGAVFSPTTEALAASTSRATRHRLTPPRPSRAGRASPLWKKVLPYAGSLLLLIATCIWFMSDLNTKVSSLIRDDQEFKATLKELSNKNSEIAERIARVEARLDALPTGVANVDAVRAQLAEMRRDLDSLVAQPQQRQLALQQHLDERLKNIERQTAVTPYR